MQVFVGNFKPIHSARPTWLAKEFIRLVEWFDEYVCNYFLQLCLKYHYVFFYVFAELAKTNLLYVAPQKSTWLRVNEGGANPPMRRLTNIPMGGKGKGKRSPFEVSEQNS